MDYGLRGWRRLFGGGVQRKPPLDGLKIHRGGDPDSCIQLANHHRDSAVSLQYLGFRPFIFLTILLYGWKAAVLLAATEALFASFQFARKPITTFQLGLRFMVGSCDLRRYLFPRGALVSDEAVVQEAKVVPAIEMPSSDISRPRNENQPKILVVDDEDAVRELLRDMLEAEDCRVYLAPGGREALGLFEVHRFDGIFTDVGMPGMSGWELAYAIRERDKTVPISVITGWGSAVGSDEQKEARVDWVITKPFRAERISELAQEITQQKNNASKRADLSSVAA